MNTAETVSTIAISLFAISLLIIAVLILRGNLPQVVNQNYMGIALLSFGVYVAFDAVSMWIKLSSQKMVH